MSHKKEMKHSYRQSYKKFHENPNACARSHKIALLTVDDLLARGVSLEDTVRCCLPRLEIKRLERIMTLVRNILSSKYASKAKYEQEALTTIFTATPFDTLAA